MLCDLQRTHWMPRSVRQAGICWPAPCPVGCVGRRLPPLRRPNWRTAPQPRPARWLSPHAYNRTL